MGPMQMGLMEAGLLLPKGEFRLEDLVTARAYS
jgi:hypothetical protein